MSSKPTKSCKLTDTDKTKIAKDISDIETQYQDIADAWPNATYAQKQAILDHSPLLKRILAFASRFTIVLLLMSSLSIFCANAWTSQRSGNWSLTSSNASSPWYDAGTQTARATIPQNTDTVTIATGHTVTYDTDNSAFANGLGAMTINGTLQASTTAGTYYLKMNATTITINSTGSFLVGSSGTAYPTNCKFTVASSASLFGSMFIGAGTLQVYGVEPTYQWCRLTSGYSIGATSLAVDTNLTSDLYWSTASTTNILVDICNYAQSNSGHEQKTCSAVATGPNTITLTSGLASAKVSGAYVVLVSRNIEFVYAGVAVTGSVIFTGSTRNAGGNGAFMGQKGASFTGVCSAPSYGLFYGAIGCTVTNGVVSRASGYGCSYAHGLVWNGGLIVGCTGASGSGFVQVTHSYINCTIVGMASSGISVVESTFAGTIDKCAYGVAAGSKVYLDGATITNSGTADVGNGEMYAYNTTLGSTTEVNGYDMCSITGSYAGVYYHRYAVSINHDGTAGAFKSWSGGGIAVSSTAVTPPTGYTQEYLLTPICSVFPDYIRFERTVGPYENIDFAAYMQKDFTETTSANRPNIEIIGAEDMSGVNPTSLASATMSDTNNAWEYAHITWYNNSPLPRQVFLLCQVMRASGNAYFVPVFEQPRESF